MWKAPMATYRDQQKTQKSILKLLCLHFFRLSQCYLLVSVILAEEGQEDGYCLKKWCMLQKASYGWQPFCWSHIPGGYRQLHFRSQGAGEHWWDFFGCKGRSWLLLLCSQWHEEAAVRRPGRRFQCNSREEGAIPAVGQAGHRDWLLACRGHCAVQGGIWFFELPCFCSVICRK